MAAVVTLTLSEYVAEQIKVIAGHLGQPVEGMMADWIARDMENQDDELQILPGEYPIYTSHGNYEAAHLLLELLHEEDEKHLRQGTP